MKMIFKKDSKMIINYSKLFIDKTYINYSDKYEHVADTIKYLMDSVYVTTNYSVSDLTALKTNHPHFLTNILIDEKQQVYHSLNQLCKNFNLNIYTDNNGLIRIKFFNPFDQSNPKNIDYYETFSITTKYAEVLNSKISYKILEDKSIDTYLTTIEATDSILNSIFALTKFKNEKEIETTIRYDFFSELFLSKTYKEILSKKYFYRTQIIEIILDMSENDLDLYDNIVIINSDIVKSTDTYKIIEKETDFNRIKITAFRLV